jgi:lipoprotein-anchoring transpeptidase ErfK/SrfK
MKALRLSGLAMAAAMAMAANAAAQDAAKTTETQDAAKSTVTAQVTAKDQKKRVIVVSLEDRKLALVEDGKVMKVYPVAVGKASTPSPVGTLTIERKVANPTYHHDGRTVAPGPGNPVGTRWMGLSKAGYGIHGTNEPKSIGKAASHGCIRMSKADLEEFYGMVEVGDTVELVGQRNEETAMLFGAPAPAAPAAQPVVMAKATPPAASAPTQNATQASTPAIFESDAASTMTAAVLAMTAGW